MNQLFVSNVKSGGQAEEAGIQIGDILISYDGALLQTNSELGGAVTRAKEAGKESVQLRLKRNGEELVLTVTPSRPLSVTCESKPSYEKIDVDSLKKVSHQNTISTTEYGVGKTMATFISYVGWLIVILGVLASFAAMSSRGGFLAAIPMLALSISGLFLIMGAQVTKATLDNADHTREILSILLKK